MTSETQHLSANARDAQARTVRDFSLGIGVVLLLLAIAELAAGVSLTGAIVVAVALGLLFNGVRSHLYTTRGHTGAIVMLIVLGLGTTSINVLAGGRAPGVLIFMPILIMLAVLLTRRRVRTGFLILAIAQFPLAWWLQSFHIEFPATPPDDWVSWAHLRMALVGGVAAFVIGDSYRSHITYYRRLADESVNMWKAELEDAQQIADRVRHFAESCSEMLWETDAENRLTWLSESFDGIFELRRSQCIGLTPRGVFTTFGDVTIDEEAFPDLLSMRKPFRNEVLRWKRSNGEVRHLVNSGFPIFDDAGVFLGFRGVLRDVTEQSRLRHRLEKAAYRDALTGLLNRAAFLQESDRWLGERIGTRSRASLAFVDLDGFKALNDKGGHAFGDDVLVRVAATLEASFPGAKIGRLGGDEFVVFSPDSSETQLADQSRVFAARLANMELIALGERLPIGASIGVYAEEGIRNPAVEQWLRHADRAVYSAKEAGKGCVIIAERS